MTSVLQCTQTLALFETRLCRSSCPYSLWQQKRLLMDISGGSAATCNQKKKTPVTCCVALCVITNSYLFLSATPGTKDKHSLESTRTQMYTTVQLCKHQWSVNQHTRFGAPTVSRVGHTPAVPCNAKNLFSATFLIMIYLASSLYCYFSYSEFS